jgi:hypothetical protein
MLMFTCSPYPFSNSRAIRAASRHELREIAQMTRCLA